MWQWFSSLQLYTFKVITATLEQLICSAQYLAPWKLVKVFIERKGGGGYKLINLLKLIQAAPFQGSQRLGDTKNSSFAFNLFCRCWRHKTWSEGTLECKCLENVWLPWFLSRLFLFVKVLLMSPKFETSHVTKTWWISKTPHDVIIYQHYIIISNRIGHFFLLFTLVFD